MNPEPARVLSAQGQELLERLAGVEVTPDRALALSAALREEYPAELVAAALTQQALRFAGRAKFSRADEMLFTRAGLEQASSEVTSRHAARRFAGARVVADLCCGIGGNLTALAAQQPDGEPRHGWRIGVARGTPMRQRCGVPQAEGSGKGRETGGGASRGAGDGSLMREAVIGVDSDPVSLEFARHNVSVYAPLARVGYVCADVRELELGGIDAVFIDPARRDARGRLPAGRYQPELDWCLGLADRVPAVGIKAAPGLRRELVPAGWETEFVAVGRELKEALLWSPELAGPRSRATVLPSGATLTSSATLALSDPPTSPTSQAATAATTLAEPGSASGDAPRAEAVPVAAPGEFLFDPNPAVTRAGLVTSLARQLGAWQIDPMIAFLSADKPAMTPFARTLRVIESAPWHEKRFAARLRQLGIGSADIRRRGLAGDVEQIHHRLGLRGPGAATIVLTRVSDRPWGLICVPVAEPDDPA
ncbi:MAG TPA: hypothetical protein VMR14_16595 [Streptosporangiaceae bacterium]|jgi:hypothetical protein|nr:hypothetical protein [Streptosporangiaceae bacterium]